ncbi:permease [Vibrio breoganii]|uniref:Permease n=1 Tax=Vibrio breoganii TaxID=553239 RepID=A0ABX1UB13_9VIBR|nr:permease [Vibrio breoganii]NMO74426.1 permease [Vibrio breoganii]NMR70381.1 permease [Vibrio breoganii]PMG03132.1 permease [Vibrio breoganii]PMG38422.1 permease [Vibrio breoganii]PMG88253.1 permease [Vibrio breoganii]
MYVFTLLASWLTYDIFGLDPSTSAGIGLHFFIEDTSKILVLLVVLIYMISYLRASLSVEKVRDYLQGKNKALGYVLGSMFGAVTPFCSCSSIPLFMGFVSARIPIGVTIAFLITSPLINEVVIIMLGSILGLKFTIMYVAIGMLLGIFAGVVLDALKAHRWLQPFLAKAYLEEESTTITSSSEPVSMNHQQRHEFAKNETGDIVKRIWKWVIIGVGIGAFIHGFVPAQWFEENLANGQWWTVPLATLSAIPIYTNASGVVPIMASLIDKGMPLGTTLAFCMGAVAVSLPEFMMLKQVMQYRLLGAIAIYLLVAISITGWLFNAFY